MDTSQHWEHDATFVCDVCEATHPMTSFELHMEAHQNPYGCPRCTLRFRTKGELRCHNCTALRSIKCIGCGLTFTKPKHYDDHYSSGNCQRSLRCSICTLQAAVLDDLSQHEQICAQVRKLLLFELCRICVLLSLELFNIRIMANVVA